MHHSEEIEEYTVCLTYSGDNSLFYNESVDFQKLCFLKCIILKFAFSVPSKITYIIPKKFLKSEEPVVK